MSLRGQAGAALVGLLCLVLLPTPVAAAPAGGRPAPPLPTGATRWVGQPTSWDSLRGRVTLVFVWTFG